MKYYTLDTTTCHSCECIATWSMNINKIKQFIKMSKLSNEARRRVVTLYLQSQSVVQICQRLNKENIVAISYQALHKLICNYRAGTMSQVRQWQGKITEGVYDA